MRYVAKHSKLRKTTKVIKLQWIASIWCQNDQTNAKLQKWSYFNELGSIWPQNDQKRWGTSQNKQNNGKLQNWSITMNCIDLRSKRSENPKLQTQSNNKQFASIWHQNDQNNAKLRKWYYFDEFGSIWRQNDQNNAKLRKWSDYNALHRFDV